MSALTNLPKALRTLRGSRTQAEVAELIGVSPQTWSDYERGHRGLSVKRLDEILEGLHLSVWDLAESLEGRKPERETERDVMREVLRPLIKEETEQQFREIFSAFMDSRSGGAGGDGRQKDRGEEVGHDDEHEKKRA